MESESAMSKQMNIAMKGHSSFYNSKLAQNLANFLKCPFINGDDIIPAIQKSLPSTSYRRFSKYSNIDLIIDIVSQISTTQLNLNLNVIINMEFSQPTHYDRLVKLANSTGATLIIIHGKTENDQGGHDVGVGHVPTVSIDTTKPFIVEDLVSLILQAARRNESIDVDLEPKGDEIVAPPSDHNKRDERDLGDMHVHEFELSKEPKKEKLTCTKCENLIISGPTYHYVECDDFILHKDCTESPTLLNLKEHRFSMKNPPNKYDFSSRIDGCQFCHEFRSSYPDCLLRANVKGAYLPTIYKYSDHEHPLNFIIMPFSFNFQYKCCACDGMGKFVSYKCFQCNYDLHTKCALVITKDVILHRINLLKKVLNSSDSLGFWRDRRIEFASVITKDGILQEVNRLRTEAKQNYNFLDKSLVFVCLTEQERIVIGNCLKIYARIHEELDIISEDLNAYSINETLPLQHANYPKTRIEFFNDVIGLS
ncbi:unnamed protein product [Dovyalis caffra]|uniref:DC1 domain-containing protein n=1 Tax=Dovyalis caffra TaxID=77055 RepID=A0AAV1QM39_9ROSI|nr:unnamed protein product [Dovyalis caffra]